MRYYERLKAVRERLTISARDVERQSREIAARLKDQEYYISNRCLLRIEGGDALLTVHQLFSLSQIYQISVPALMKLCGVGREGKQYIQRREAALLDQLAQDAPHDEEGLKIISGKSDFGPSGSN